MRSSLDYAGFAQLCGRSPIMREIMRAHNRIILRSLGDIDRLLRHGRRSAAAACECVQCHVFSVRRKLNTDLVNTRASLVVT